MYGHSGYKFEAAWPRTMLAGLESKGKDKEAIAEYFLGERKRFFQMALGKENVENNRYGEALLGVNEWDEDQTEDIDYAKLFNDMYHSPELDFSNINRNSIYFRKNYILPAYILQNKLGDKADLVGVLQEGKQYDVNFIASKLFGGKKFFEVPREELEDFIILLDGQVWPKKISPIINADRYTKDEINRVNPKDMENHSFEILYGIPAFAGKRKIINGISMEKLVEKATEIEIRKALRSQSEDETEKKKEMIVKAYKTAFEDNIDNMFIMESIKDLEFYCEQIKYLRRPKKTVDMDIE